MSEDRSPKPIVLNYASPAKPMQRVLPPPTFWSRLNRSFGLWVVGGLAFMGGVDSMEVCVSRGDARAGLGAMVCFAVSLLLLFVAYRRFKARR